MDFTVLIFASALAASVPTGHKEIGKAYLRQTGLDRTLKRLERDALSPESRELAGKVVFVTSVLVNQQLVLRFTFP